MKEENEQKTEVKMSEKVFDESNKTDLRPIKSKNLEEVIVQSLLDVATKKWYPPEKG